MKSLSALGDFRNDLSLDLSPIPLNYYENIFRMYSTENTDKKDFYYYNILNAIYIPDNIAPDYYYTITLIKSVPWTVISYNEYKTVSLWWLICLANNIYNPVELPSAGTELKIIKSEYVQSILSNINSQLANI